VDSDCSGELNTCHAITNASMFGICCAASGC
jgi:hypothetical protein